MKKIFFEIVEFIKNPNDQRIDNYSLVKNFRYLWHIQALNATFSTNV
ncbi:hypothetical protein [Ornithobacterium rhinotracheale]